MKRSLDDLYMYESRAYTVSLFQVDAQTNSDGRLVAFESEVSVRPQPIGYAMLFFGTHKLYLLDRTNDMLIIGRSVDACDICSPELSKVHAIFTLTSDGLFVTDHSTNGTYINQARIKKFTSTKLKDGDELSCKEDAIKTTNFPRIVVKCN